MPADTTRSLSALKTAQDAAKLAWGHRDDLLRLAVVPVLASFALDVVAAAASGTLWAAEPQEPQPLPGLLQAVLLAGDVLLSTLFSVNWLRVLLLAEARGRPSLELRWTRRHGLFLGRSLLLAAGFTVAVLLVAGLTTGLGAIGAGPGGMAPTGMLALAVMALAGGYLFLRLSLVLPAAAVDHPYDFSRSWRDTATAGAPMLLAVLILALVLTLVALGVVAVAAGIYAAAPLSALLLNHVMDYGFAAILLGVVAIAFHRCTGWRDPGGAAAPQPPATSA